MAAGEADVALGLEAAARQFRLGFVPVQQERFDLLVNRRCYFTEPVQTLMDFARSDAMARKAKSLEGYDLSELGKVGPYAVGRERLIRRWQSFDPRDPAVHILHRTRLGSVTGDHAEFAWLPIYSQVNGELPLDELPVFRMNPAPARVTVVRFQLEQTQPGPVAVKFNSFDGLTVWRNAEPVAPAETVQWDGTPGIQTFTIAIDLAARTTPLRCELIDVPDSAAQIQPAAGK